MLKRIILTTVLLIGAPVTVVAKVSLENIRQPEAAVEETLIDAEHAAGGASMPAEHCRPRDSDARASVSGRLEKTSESACGTSNPSAARPTPVQAMEPPSTTG